MVQLRPPKVADRERVRAAAAPRRPGSAARSAGTCRPGRCRTPGPGTAPAPTTCSRPRSRCARRAPRRSGCALAIGAPVSAQKSGSSGRQSSIQCLPGLRGRPGSVRGRRVGWLVSMSGGSSSRSCSGTSDVGMGYGGQRDEDDLVVSSTSTCRRCSGSAARCASNRWPGRRRSGAAGRAPSRRRSGRRRSGRPCGGRPPTTACTAPSRSRKTATCSPRHERPALAERDLVTGPSRCRPATLAASVPMHGGHRVGTGPAPAAGPPAAGGAELAGGGRLRAFLPRVAVGVDRLLHPRVQLGGDALLSSTTTARTCSSPIRARTRTCAPATWRSPGSTA